MTEDMWASIKAILALTLGYEQISVVPWQSTKNRYQVSVCAAGMRSLLSGDSSMAQTHKQHINRATSTV